MSGKPLVFEDEECDGSGDCPAVIHIHGCYADELGENCDDPAEHEWVEARKPREKPEFW